MRFGSLFTGIGGLDLGLEAAGFDCAWQVEWDPFCRHILERWWPDTTRYEDIHDVAFGAIDPVDILIGGFPCQPVSDAGRKLMDADPRWLWPEFRRAIGEARPAWVVIENVRGLINRGLLGILRDLAELGYDAEWDLISASDVGALHERERVIVLAHAHGPGPQGHGGLDLFGSGARQLVTWTRGRAVEGVWKSEPDVGRVANGVPKRVDRLRALGNAVVPQVAEAVGWILADAIQRAGVAEQRDVTS